MAAERRPRVTIASRIWDPEPAAASFRLLALAQGLLAEGASTRVLTAAAPARYRPRDPAGLRVSRAGVLRDASGYLRGTLPYLSFDAPLALRLLRDPAPDVYVCEPPPTTGVVVRAVAALRRRPYVAYAPDVWGDAIRSTGASAPLAALVGRLEAVALGGAARVLAVSEPVARRLRELGIERVEVVRGGVDTRIFTPDGPGPDDADASQPGRGDAGAGDTAPRPAAPYLLYAGTASEWQGADVFLRALPAVLAEVPGARVVFLGQGSAWADLGRRAHELSRGSVELRAQVPPEEAARWQRGARAALVSINPGVGYDLAYPTKAYAAWACGTPVIYAGPGPARDDILRHRLGWAVDHDAGAVARAMTAALTSPAPPNEEARIAAWARANVSAEVSGRRAARVVLEAARAG